jgi:hypothetical protein
MENKRGSFAFNNLLTRVVFPAPEGAEIITALPWKSLDEFIRCLKLVL